MARPLALDDPQQFETSHDARIRMLKEGDMSSYEQYATTEQERELRRLGDDIDADFGEVETYEDGNLRPTIPE